MSSSPALVYATPAASWEEALPLGNGRLGAMVFGPPQAQRWQVNDDTCWSGWPGSVLGRPASDEPSPEVVSRARAALLAGDVATAEAEVRKVQYGHSQAYQPLGEVTLLDPGAADLVTRRLDLAAGVVSWRLADGTTGESFASAPDQALLVEQRWARPATVEVLLTAAHAGLGHSRVEGDGDDGLVLVSRMPSDVWPGHDRSEDAVHFDQTPGRAVTAVLALRLDTDGRLEPAPGAGAGLRVVAATRLRLVLTSATDFVDPLTPPHGRLPEVRADAVDRARGLLSTSGAELRRRHEADHRALFDRFDVELGDGSDPVDADTDLLLARAAGGDVDPALVALVVQYGRYLLMGSSRPGSRAANLQGIWSPHLQPPWSSNYTVNINTEMNYWPAHPTNLVECAEPLHELVELVARTGTETARRVYGLPGWAVHHNVDVWGFTLPVGTGTADPAWAAWPMAGPWLLRHLQEHHRFTGDPRVLERAWPLVDGAAQFLLGWLVRLPDQTLGTAPSTSPENRYLTADGPAAVTVSATMDIALCRDLLRFWLRCADAVPAEQVPVGRREQVADALAALPLPTPTDRGTYPEWREDLPEAEPTHRHQSHLYDVHPGDAVTRYDPRHAGLLAAASETLRRRGSYSTGWSIGWRVCLHARLADVAAAESSIGHYLRLVGPGGSGPAGAGGVQRNLLCSHPPFQIDGSFGVTAGVVEMLLQSHGTVAGRVVLDLLPCLPAAWQQGRLSGVRARGGLVLDLGWAGGQVQRLRVVAASPVGVLLRRPGCADEPVDLPAGETVLVEGGIGRSGSRP